jgi:hypothetical protein
VTRTVDVVERGIYRRISPRTGEILPTLHFHYSQDGRVRQESAHTTSIRVARAKRAERLAAVASGEEVPRGRLTIAELLAELVRDYERNEQTSLPSVRGSVKAWLAAGIGTLRPHALRPEQITAIGDGWKRVGLSNATINRRNAALRRAYSLACRTGLLRAGIRRGQLARTQRRFVDLERAVIEWPPEECKAREPHVLPLEGRSLALIERALKRVRLWCPYVFHGRWCRGGRRPSKKYGCLGDFRKTWASACVAADLPVGTVAGGYVFHDTRRTAATTLRAGGLDEARTMQVTGHKTVHVFREYNLEDVEKLRDELTKARYAAVHGRRSNWRRVIHSRRRRG